MDYREPNIDLEDVVCPNGCPIGSKIVLKDRDRLHNAPGIYSVYECQTCSLQRTTPRPTPSSMHHFYPDDYGPYSDKPFSIGRTRGFKGMFYKLFKLNTRVLPLKSGSMLELGCSSGSYMEYAKSEGWDVEGVEYSINAAKVAIDKGFKVHVGALEDIPNCDKKFDLIVAWMVMEHLHQPVQVLNNLNSWLKDDGYLVFLVPDSNGLSRKLFNNLSYDLHLPNHLFHYNAKSIEILLEKTNWKLERIFWQRNCTSILGSFVHWSKENEKSSYLKVARWLSFSRLASPIRLVFSIILGATKQSGKMEIWARPVKSK